MEMKRLLLLRVILPGVLCLNVALAEMTVSFTNHSLYYIHFDHACGNGSGPAVIQPKKKGMVDIYTNQVCSFSIDKTTAATSDIGKGYVKQAGNSQQEFQFFLVPTIRPDMLPMVDIVVNGSPVEATNASSVIFPLGSPFVAGNLDHADVTFTVQTQQEAMEQHKNEPAQGIAGLLQRIGT
jgi:hypothetical protein